MLDIAETNASKSRDKRSANMGDPKEDDEAADAVPAEPLTVAAREAIRAPAGTREGSIMVPQPVGERWGRNMTLKPTGDWHGTRTGKPCTGVPLAEADQDRGLVKGQCPDCGAHFEKQEPNMGREDARAEAAKGETIIVDPKHAVQKSREMQRLEISRQTRAKMLKKLGVDQIVAPEHIAEYDAEVRKAYKYANL